MDKIVSTSSLKKVASGIINKVDNLVDERLDGKSFVCVTQEEYDNLSDEEKNNDDIIYQITDSELSYNDLVDTPDLDIYTTKELLNMSFIFDDYYSKSLYNDDLKLLVDYGEGDIYFTLCSNKESYQAEKQRTINFYNENY